MNGFNLHTKGVSGGNPVIRIWKCPHAFSWNLVGLFFFSFLSFFFFLSSLILWVAFQQFYNQHFCVKLEVYFANNGVVVCLHSSKPRQQMSFACTGRFGEPWRQILVPPLAFGLAAADPCGTVLIHNIKHLKYLALFTVRLLFWTKEHKNKGGLLQIFNVSRVPIQKKSETQDCKFFLPLSNVACGSN